jgi:hypothetical protein
MLARQWSTTGLLLVAFAGAWSCTGANPDYMQTTCEVGLRLCVDSPRRPSYPVVCGRNTAGQLTLIDERCPQGAQCQAGLCLAPSGAKSCSRQRDCGATEACVPLLKDASAKALAQFCLPAAAAALAPAQRCERDEDCKTFFCVPFRNGNFCLKACTDDKDCTSPESCRPVDMTITGIAGRVQSCNPPR